MVIVSSDKDMLQLVDERVHMYNPVKEDVWYDPATAEGVHGCEAHASGRSARAHGRFGRQYSGRARNRRERRAKHRLRASVRWKSALEHAAEVEKKTYRESLQNNREQILLSKRLATIDITVPVEFEMANLATQEPDIAELKKVYKELEFYSLLKEVGPTEDAHTRDYSSMATREEAVAYGARLAKLDPAKPIAFAIESTVDGDLPLTMIGVASEPGVARALSVDFIDAVKPILEDRASNKDAHDVKAVTLALAKQGVEAKGFRHDVMLYAFLLCADPSACSPCDAGGDAISIENWERPRSSMPIWLSRWRNG